MLLINLFVYVPPMFLNIEKQEFQREIDQANILKADLFIWNVEVTLENNIHLIVALSLLFLSVIFFAVGMIRLKNKYK